MKSACVGVLWIIELKNARWNIEKSNLNVRLFLRDVISDLQISKYRTQTIGVDRHLANRYTAKLLAVFFIAYYTRKGEALQTNKLKQDSIIFPRLGSGERRTKAFNH